MKIKLENHESRSINVEIISIDKDLLKIKILYREQTIDYKLNMF